MISFRVYCMFLQEMRSLRIMLSDHSFKHMKPYIVTYIAASQQNLYKKTRKIKENLKKQKKYYKCHLSIYCAIVLKQKLVLFYVKFYFQLLQLSFTKAAVTATTSTTTTDVKWLLLFVVAQLFRDVSTNKKSLFLLIFYLFHTLS